MNQFYVASNQISENTLTLEGQEAKHAAKVLRKGVGQSITATDGEGRRYTGTIESIRKDRVTVHIEKAEQYRKPDHEIILSLGLIRKRDRLEFAAEKATELGVTSICLFRGDHTEPFNVRMDRVESAVVSAMKQSLRVFLPEIKLFNSIDDLAGFLSEDVQFIVANQQGDFNTDITLNSQSKALFIGPEGGLSLREKNILQERNAVSISLGDFRLRAETAAMVLSERFGIKRAVQI